ncbi:MAG: phosphatase PAP2 family protein [Bdellovibrionota bacterium]
MTVPQLVYDRRSKWVCFILGGAATLCLYQWTNRIFLTEPHLLKFDAVDSIMPFWPWTVWVYFTEYIFFIVAYFGLRSSALVTRYFYAYMAILITSIAIFIIFPVTFPRADYPVAGVTFSEHALIFLRTYMDSPANCLPSLHVSSCYISALCFWQESRRKAWLFILWSTGVAISTMTAKQHYFLDVWTAMLLTGFFFWIFFYRVELAPPPNGSGNAAGAKP